MGELRDFLIHLRVHYQLLILSGGYLLGGLFVEQLNLPTFAMQFFNVHILLNGGITAYNSFWDDDEGPIGGLPAPPKMKPWMHHASIALQLIGLALAARQGTAFAGLWILTMALSVAYSRPKPRWKGRPWLSLLAIGILTGTNTFLMGYLAAGGPGLTPEILVAAAGAASLLLSLYPVSQVFQVKEDLARGDHTFAATYGLEGVRRWFVFAYGLGLGVVTATLHNTHPKAGLLFGAVGLAGALLNGAQLWRLKGDPKEYKAVMQLKYGASLSFIAVITACLVWVHG